MIALPEMFHKQSGINDIPTQVKNPELVEKRRRQIIDASVRLFIEKGFHKTTTRQIAKASGISIGSLYEYVQSKEDILYLVCEAIHGEVEKGVNQALKTAESGKEAIYAVIREYLTVCNGMSGHILLIYRETQTLPENWRKRVLENEVRITGLFYKALLKIVGGKSAANNLPKVDDRALELIAHNISVLGHMWTFRRWFLSRHYTLDEYINIQADFIIGFFNGGGNRG